MEGEPRAKVTQLELHPILLWACFAYISRQITQSNTGQRRDLVGYTTPLPNSRGAVQTRLNNKGILHTERCHFSYTSSSMKCKTKILKRAAWFKTG
jgi:hypothetical protein